MSLLLLLPAEERSLVTLKRAPLVGKTLFVPLVGGGTELELIASGQMGRLARGGGVRGTGSQASCPPSSRGCRGPPGPAPGAAWRDALRPHAAWLRSESRSFACGSLLPNLTVGWGSGGAGRPVRTEGGRSCEGLPWVGCGSAVSWRRELFSGSRDPLGGWHLTTSPPPRVLPQGRCRSAS